MRKLSGLISLCKNPLECTYSILVICPEEEEKVVRVKYIRRCNCKTNKKMNEV